MHSFTLKSLIHLKSNKVGEGTSLQKWPQQYDVCTELC